MIAIAQHTSAPDVRRIIEIADRRVNVDERVRLIIAELFKRSRSPQVWPTIEKAPLG
jgi:GTP cyclohydrolase I